MKEPKIEYYSLFGDCVNCDSHSDVEVAKIKRGNETRIIERCESCGYVLVNLGEGFVCAGQANGEEPMRLLGKLEEFNLLAIVGWDDE